MRVLLVDAYEADDVDRVAAIAAADALTDAGHTVEHLALGVDDFSPFMTVDERAAYHDDDPLISPDTRRSADAIKRADALLFCYPTTTFTVPSRLKGWLERVMVPGVAFVFDAKGRVAPGMTNVRRLGIITTTPHSRVRTRRARDLGRRTILWGLRLNCHRRCRRTFVRIPAGAVEPGLIRQQLRRW